MGGMRVEPRWAPDTSPAEKHVFEQLCRTLPATVAVLPQVLITVGEHGRMEEAEADLVLVDPDHGLVVVEVKGGTLSYDPERMCWRRREAGMKAIRDPVKQAKRARSFIRKALEDARFPVEEVPIRWAVAVPECTLESPGESVLPAACLWDARSLGDPAATVRATQGPMGDGEAPIGEVRATAIVRTLRGRAVEGTPSRAAKVAEHGWRVQAFTESHRNVKHRFMAAKRVLVRGAAGTGKTMLALEMASTFAAQGERVLLTCWHRLLAEELREGLQARLDQIGSPRAKEVTDNPIGQLVVDDLASLAGGGTAPGGVAPTKWFYEQLPNRLSAQRTGGPFDVIVLDEAQDPSEYWLLALSGLLRDGGRWYAFADRQQDLFGTHAGLPDFVDIAHELRENFRNTRQIAEFAYPFGPYGDGRIETDCLTGDGPEVRLVRVPADRIVGRTPEVARKLARDEGFRADQVAAIWLFHNPWQGDPDGLIAQHKGGELVTTNSAAFKGLERDVVVLGVDTRPDRTATEHKRALYAAATRARSLLVVLADPATLRQAELYLLASQFKD